MILKAGTYRFNEVINTNNTYLDSFDPFELSFVYNGSNYQYLVFYFSHTVNASPSLDLYQTLMAFGVDVDSEPISIYHYSINNGEVDPEYSGYLVSTPVEITIPDCIVSSMLGDFLITNTNYNEVNAKPLAEITYNGETIAQLNAGETATLSCKDKKMASDLSVKIESGYVKPSGSTTITENGTYPVTDKEEVVVDVPIPDGYVKPEGTLEITLNNIEANPIDCSRYAKVTVNTAEPLRISDPTVLDNITDSPWGVGGSVFLYEGATTDDYENGAYYLLEDTEK